LLRSAAQFSLATVAMQAAGLVRSYVLARWLGPAAAGVWLGLQLIISYGASAHLGALFGMHRNVPLLLGAGDNEGAEAIKRTALSFTVLMGLLSLLFVAGAAGGWLSPLSPLLPARAAVALSHLSEPGLSEVVFAVALVLPANLIKAYYVVLLRAQSRFRASSLAALCGSAVGIASTALIPRYGLVGAVWGLLAMVGAETACLMVAAGVPRFGFDLRVLRAQLSFGLLALAISLVSTLMSSIDRTVLLERFGSADVRGLYNPALLMATFFGGIAQVPNAVLYPRLTERFGRSRQPADLAPLVEWPLNVLTAGMALSAGAAAIALPLSLRYLLPGFVAGTHAAQIAMVGIAFVVVVGVVNNVFLSLDRQWHYLVIITATAGAGYAITNAWVSRWPTLEAVAAGTSVAYVGSFVASVLLASRLMGRSLRLALLSLGRALAPMAWSTAAAAAVLALSPPGLPVDTLAGAAIAELAFAVLSAPVAVLLVRRLRSGRL